MVRDHGPWECRDDTHTQPDAPTLAHRSSTAEVGDDWRSSSVLAVEPANSLSRSAWSRKAAWGGCERKGGSPTTANVSVPHVQAAPTAQHRTPTSVTRPKAVHQRLCRVGFKAWLPLDRGVQVFLQVCGGAIAIVTIVHTKPSLK